MTRPEVPSLLTLSGAVLEAQWDRVGHITLSDRSRRPVGREKKKKPRCLILGTRTIGAMEGRNVAKLKVTSVCCVTYSLCVLITSLNPYNRAHGDVQLHPHRFGTHARSGVATSMDTDLLWTACHPPASLRAPPRRPSRTVFFSSSCCVRTMLLHAHCRMRPYMPCVVPLPITSRSGARHLRLCAGLLSFYLQRGMSHNCLGCTVRLSVRAGWDRCS